MNVRYGVRIEVEKPAGAERIFDDRCMDEHQTRANEMVLKGHATKRAKGRPGYNLLLRRNNVDNVNTFLNKTVVVWKTAIASTLSWEVATWTGSKHPYLAPLTVILCLQVTVDQSIRFAVQRVIGTSLGVLLTAFIADYIGVGGWRLGLFLLVGTAIAKWLKLSDKVIHQVALSVLFVLYFESQSRGYALDRLKDTVIGAVVGILAVMLLLPPDFTKKAVQSFEMFAEHVSVGLENLSKWLENGCPARQGIAILSQTKTLFDEIHKSLAEFTRAFESVKFNPYAKNKHSLLDQYHKQFIRLQQVYVHFLTVSETLIEWAETGTLTSDDQALWAKNLLVLASYIKGWKVAIATDTQPAQPPKLTIQFPEQMGKYRYPLAIYTEVLHLLQDLRPFS